MTRTPRPTNRRRRAERARPDRRFAVVLAAVVVAGIAGIVVTRSTTPDGGPASGPAPTGEQNAMGMPVVATPGEAAGRSAAGGVVVDGADWALGSVPLNVAVRPAWTLRNTGDQAVTLGDPHPEIREGCCPGPYTFTSRRLPPGESADLTFELSMHPGMDGWHDIVTHVPVVLEDGRQELLALGVTGDFRN